MEHGTRSMYNHRGCRCETCRSANAASKKALRRVNSLRLQDAPHGSVNAYLNWGCRCEPCKAAHSANLKDRRARGLAG
jgi:hypothetical protein